MRNLMMVAVYRMNEGGHINVIYSDKGVPTHRVKYFDENGTLLSCVITNDEVIYLKSRLKAGLFELRDYCSKCYEYLADKENQSNEEVYHSTLRLMTESQEVLVDQVGLLVSRLLMKGVDVTDELAIVCHNYRLLNRH